MQTGWSAQVTQALALLLLALPPDALGFLQHETHAARVKIGFTTWMMVAALTFFANRLHPLALVSVIFEAGHDFCSPGVPW